MGEQERKDIIDCVTSLLISTTERMTIKQLQYDFENTVGYKIPYRKFGCSNIEHFLRTLRDKVQVHGSGPYARIEVIASEKTAHINNLISQQKTKFPSHPRRRFYYNRNLKTSKQAGSKSEQLNKTECANVNHTDTASETLKGAPVVASFSREMEKASDSDDVYYSEDETQENNIVPQIIQNNLKNLIIKYPDGIWSSNLLSLYKNEYGKLLSFEDYGYRSVAEMCADLKNIFSVVQLHSNDVKLFDKNRSIPKDTLNIISRLQLMKIKATADAPTCNAIPNISIEEFMGDYYSEKTPPDIVEFGTVLQQQWLESDAKEQDYVDVNIGQVYDPSKFWLNLRPYAKPLNVLMDRMQEFYANHKTDLAVPYYALRKGLYVACVIDREYHRGKIVDASQKNERLIKIYFIDHGTVSMISIDLICYLHKQFSELPEQAIRARLAGIYPPAENEQWSRTAASRFLDLIMDKDLVAQLIKVDEEDHILDIVLADTSQADEDFFINDALVHMGFALFTFQPRYEEKSTNIVPIVRYIHLFPTFDELESGLVPTAIQMLTMHYAGVSIEQAYPHYFKDKTTGLPISVDQLSAAPNNNFSIDAKSCDKLQIEVQNSSKAEIECLDEVNDANVSASTDVNWENIVEDADVQATVNKDVYLQDTVGVKDTVKMSTQDICIQTDSGDETQSKDDSLNKSGISQETAVSETIDEAVQVNCIKEDCCTSSTQTSESTNFSAQRCVADNVASALPIPTIKKPVRPPPGYGPLPQNVTINYNNTGPTNYLASQTYVNMPVDTNYHNVTLQQKNAVYINYLNSLVMCGIQLTPEQLHYVQLFYVGYRGAVKPLLVPCRYNQVPVNYQYPVFYNQNTYPMPPYVPNTTTVASQENIPNESSPSVVEDSNNRNSAVNILEMPSEERTTQTTCHKVEPDPNNLKETFSNSSGVNSNLHVSSSDYQNRQSDKSNIDASVETENKKNGEERLNPQYVNVNNMTGIIADNDSEKRNSDYLSDRCSNHSPDVENFKESILSDMKFVTKFDFNKLHLHIINYDKHLYFLLSELSEKLFGTTLTIIQLRRLSVGSPHTISVLDIRLKTNPELKKELLQCELITEDEFTVDVVPTKYLRSMTEIIPNMKNHENLDEILKEVDHLL